MDKISILLEHLLMNTRSNPVTWFEIYVEDLTRAKAFYETVFGCTLLPEMTDGSFEAFRFPGGMLNQLQARPDFDPAVLSALLQ